MSFFSSLSNVPTLFLLVGESNAEGIIPQSGGATGGELGVRSSVNILKSDLSAYEVMNIGTNNMPHGGSAGFHGFELGIANRVDLSEKYIKPVYLLKSGIGSTLVSSWINGGVNYSGLVSKIQAAIAKMPNPNYRICILMSLGINDGLAGTAANTFKTQMTTHINELRALCGGSVPVIMTRFEGMGSGGTAYNYISTALQEVAASMSNVSTVSGSATLLVDGNHWNYGGSKTVVDRMLDIYEAR